MDDFEILADILLAATSSGTFEDDQPLTSNIGAGSEGEAAERRALVAERLRATAGVVGFTDMIRC
jgi:hypothetical protein